MLFLELKLASLMQKSSTIAMPAQNYEFVARVLNPCPFFV
jgi:hypothetical protein